MQIQQIQKFQIEIWYRSEWYSFQINTIAIWSFQLNLNWWFINNKSPIYASTQWHITNTLIYWWHHHKICWFKLRQISEIFPEKFYDIKNERILFHTFCLSGRKGEKTEITIWLRIYDTTQIRANIFNFLCKHLSNEIKI